MRIASGIKSLGSSIPNPINVENNRPTASPASHQFPFIVRITGNARAAHTMLPSAVLIKVVAHLAEPKAVETHTLSAREMQVLELLTQGAANKEIAARLHIVERTVKAHVTSIFNKLGVNSRTEAVVVALRKRLLPEL